MSAPADPSAPAARRRRDAAETRRLLLEAARRRFAANGYAATTVRDIADEAGVNVALINRYFSSKEGLFEQCLSVTHDEVRSTVDVPLERIAEAIAAKSGGLNGRLGLLLRSSGDERADEIRIGVLRGAAERLATISGWAPGLPGGDDLLIRAELLMATALGLALMRGSTPVEPLASASQEEIVAPLNDLVQALLSSRSGHVPQD